ncbi:MAG: RNA polymerase sigma factor FliA, partial [Pseudomonadota bacterium]
MNAYADAVQAGSADANHDLVFAHVDLVKRIAHHLLTRLPASVELDDLLQAGLIGLLEASNNFNADKGASFETYAGIRIRGAMLDEVRKLDWTPRSVHQKHRHVSQAIHNLEGRLNRSPTEREIAAELDISMKEYHRILADSSNCRLFSIERPSDAHDSGMEIPDTSDHEPESGFSADQNRAVLAEAIRGIPEREQLVLSLYYHQELNLKEIGEILEVSESRVSQIHSQALARLRAQVGTDD